MIKWFKDFVHNCVVHPLLPFIPLTWGEKLHKANANWAYPDLK